MRRLFFPGGSYVDALPTGHFAVLFPGRHIETHHGRIALPPGDEPLYHRITHVGGFRIAGQAHHSSRTLEWIAGDWQDRPSACGVSPVIYDAFGILHLSQCGPVGSQGFRYVAEDGRIVTGDETYSSFVGLSEWSAYGGLSIGQGHDGGGLLVYDGSVLRELEPGDCRFVRVQGEGSQVAISTVTPEGAVIMFASLDELRALPARVPSLPAPVPIPVPVPEPPPMSQLDTVKAIRQKYPTPLGVRHWEFLVELAQATGAQLFRKEFGDNVLVPALHKRVSMDVIGRGRLGNVWVDVLGDAEGAAVPTWDEHQGAEGEYLDVSGILLPGAPPPDPSPTPPPSSDHETRIHQLEVQVSRLVAALRSV